MSNLFRLGPELLNKITLELPLVDRFCLGEAYPGTRVDDVVFDTLARQTGLCLLLEENSPDGFDLRVPLPTLLSPPQYGFRVKDQPALPLIQTPLKGFSPPNTSEEMFTIGYQTLKRMLKLTTNSNFTIELKNTFARLSTLKLVTLDPALSKLKMIRKVVGAFARQLKELVIIIDCPQEDSYGESFRYGSLGEEVEADSEEEENDIHPDYRHFFPPSPPLPSKSDENESNNSKDEDDDDFEDIYDPDFNSNDNPANRKNIFRNFTQTAYLIEDLNNTSNFPQLKHLTLHLDETLLYGYGDSKYHSRSDADSSEGENSEEEKEDLMKTVCLNLLAQVEEAYLRLSPMVILDSSALLGSNPNLKRLGIIMSGAHMKSTFVLATISVYPSLARRLEHLIDEDSKLNFRLFRIYRPFKRLLCAQTFTQLTHLSADVMPFQYVAILTALASGGGGGSIRELSFNLNLAATQELPQFDALEHLSLPFVVAFSLFLGGTELERHETFAKIAPLSCLFAHGLRFLKLTLFNCPGAECADCGRESTDKERCIRTMLRPVVVPLRRLERLDVEANFGQLQRIAADLLAEVKAAANRND